MRNGAALHPARPCASLDLGDSQLSVDALGNELDLCADLERKIDALWDAVGALMPRFTPAECANYFRAAGYDPD